MNGRCVLGGGYSSWLGSKKYEKLLDPLTTICFCIVFLDFQNHTTSVVPIMLDFFDGTDAELSVVIDSSDFHVRKVNSEESLYVCKSRLTFS